MRHAPPHSRIRHILLPRHLLAGEHIPKPEFGFQLATRILRYPPGHECLRLDHFPRGKIRHRIGVGHLLDKGRLVDRLEKPRALQIIHDHRRNLRIQRRIRPRKIRNRDRDRLKRSLINRDGDFRPPGVDVRHRTQKHPGEDHDKVTERTRDSQIDTIHQSTSFMSNVTLNFFQSS